MNKKFLSIVNLVVGLAYIVGASTAVSGEEFYKGKTIRINVGAAPGGDLIPMPG